MNAERLLEHYERIADAPDVIARLRGLVLDLAVRGKLVPQDPNDERASELLVRVSEQKRGIANAGRSASAAANAYDKPFDLPNTWCWVKLEEILLKLTDGTHHSPPSASTGDFKYITAKNIKNYGVSIVDVTYVSQTVHTEIYSRCDPENGDILYIKDGATTGIATINNLSEPFSMLSSVALLKLSSYLFNRLILLFLRSPFFYDQMRGFMKGAAITRVTLKRMAPALLPLPPLAEQHRIVAKVTELMALCDELEAARTKREATRDRFTAANYARLSAPDPDPIDFADHARFALQSVNVLTARPDQIKQLRQTILNLAVRGKLVPQNPNDDPASELLKRIAKAKLTMKRETRDARIQQAFDPSADSILLMLPIGWVIQSFDNLFLFIDYRGSTPQKTPDGIPLITAKNVRMGYMNREPREYVSAATFKAWMTRGFPCIGDLFFTTEAPLGNVCVNNIVEPFALAQRVICFHPYAQINTRFVMFALMSDVMQSLIGENATGLTAKGIKAAKLKPLPIPVPPLGEQHRIVEKVDELMSLCDRLEQSLAAGEDMRRRLLDALIADALKPAEQADTDEKTPDQEPLLLPG